MHNMALIVCESDIYREMLAVMVRSYLHKFCYLTVASWDVGMHSQFDCHSTGTDENNHHCLVYNVCHLLGKKSSSYNPG